MAKTIELESPLLGLWVRDVKGGLVADIYRASYLPITSLKALNGALIVEDAHAFDDGKYREWTRYYREQYGYNLKVRSGICYHLQNDGKMFCFAEYLNQRRRSDLRQAADMILWPDPEGNERVDDSLFYETLQKILIGIYQENGCKVPDLSELCSGKDS